MIDARGLHEWLGHKARFNDWMRRRIEEYGFTDGADFYSVVSKTGGRPKTDYFLTVGMAKELAMVERSKIGQMTRLTLPRNERCVHHIYCPRSQLRKHAPTIPKLTKLAPAFLRV